MEGVDCAVEEEGRPEGKVDIRGLQISSWVVWLRGEMVLFPVTPAIVDFALFDLEHDNDFGLEGSAVLFNKLAELIVVMVVVTVMHLKWRRS